MNKIEFFSFKDAPDSLKEEWIIAAGEVIKSGQFIGGPFVEKFETEWASYLGVNHAIGVGNGYDAIYIALKILGLGKGDLVAVPSHTFIATWLAVGAVGATPIGIDCDRSGVMNLDLLENHDFKFAAVIPVHMHGQMVNMPRLMNWAKERHVKVVEDCAQAHGAKLEGKFAGTWGDFGAFSYYPTKNLGALGDAGALVTNTDELALKSRSYVNYGSIPGNKYEYQFRGINSRLDPIQAALLSVNLKYLDLWNLRRKAIAKEYTDCLIPLGVKTLTPSSNSVHHHYIILSNNRDKTRELLDSKGIKTEVHYPECAAVSYGKFGGIPLKSDFEVALEISNKSLSLPISPWMSGEKIGIVLEAIQTDQVLASLK